MFNCYVWEAVTYTLAGSDKRTNVMMEEKNNDNSHVNKGNDLKPRSNQIINRIKDEEKTTTLTIKT